MSEMPLEIYIGKVTDKYNKAGFAWSDDTDVIYNGTKYIRADHLIKLEAVAKAAREYRKQNTHMTQYNLDLALKELDDAAG